MKVSDKTIEILKNFSNINNGMVIRSGKQQTTVSPDDAIFVVAQIEDDFPSELGLYELPNFLTNLTMLDSAELNFSDNEVTMTDKDGFNITYRGCAKEIIHTPAETMINLKIDNPDIEFNLTLAQIQKLSKVANINTFEYLVVFAKNGQLSVKVYDQESDTSNSGTLPLGEIGTPDFKAMFKVEKLKIIPQNYNVKIKKEAFAVFENTDGTLRYIIALESESAKKRGKQ